VPHQPRRPIPAGLADPASGRDACGVGLVADTTGRERRRVLPLALTALARMAHRGAVDADGRTGDGAGVTTQLPHALLSEELAKTGVRLPRPGCFAAGLLLLPRRRDDRRACTATVERVLATNGLPLLAWRRPPVRDEALGQKARACRPGLLHLLVGRPDGIAEDAFEARLFRARRQMERRLAAFAPESFSVVSLSPRTLVYKALVRGVDLPAFYPDLGNPLYETSFALFHQRYSTNTSPSWALAQPFRLLAHNGEINTIAGNRARMRAREAAIAAAGGRRRGWRPPLLEGCRSDSASLDNAAELLVRSGRSLLHTMTMLLPPAWEKDGELEPGVRAFYEYHAGLMEPWDGPALAVFSDGRIVGAAMDRNGLRPARTLEMRDGLFLLASEAGVAAVEEQSVSRRGRLGPADLVAVDLATGEIAGTQAIRARLAAAAPYARWLRTRRNPPRPVVLLRKTEAPRPIETLRLLKAFGYTREELQLVLGPMYREGREPLGSMGDDTPLAVLSKKPRLLYSYFKQRFAQVTNPPIDPIREGLVMSLGVLLGPRGSLLSGSPEPSGPIRLETPLLSEAELAGLLRTVPRGKTRRLSLTFPAVRGTAGFERALEALCRRAASATEEGVWLLLLSDRGVDARRAALPALLAAAAVHQELLGRGRRSRASLLIETGDARDENQVAALLAFGADAVGPYLALKAVRAAAAEAPDAEGSRDAPRRYLVALERGLAKILSKMGIATLSSYQGACLFEALGLSEELVAKYFPGAGSPIGGIGLPEIAAETLLRHAAAFASETTGVLEQGGFHGFRGDGEAHAFSPDVVRKLHSVARSGESPDYESYASLVASREPLAVRDLLDFAPPPGGGVAIAEVEPVEAILRRFTTSAMSLGALSPEAHATLAVAMNRIGARSNGGEGGADPERFWSKLPGGDSANDRVKQVASARFGVTAEYLVSAEELQIKMAQGSKPGEGGQLPGHKVTPYIARLRHSQEGVTLISPPPHHDIYSIEDLAELVYDLKRVNPRARVGVKLVATSGVGTIAVGVVKAFADAILVSGHDGGTGASPLGSIKNAGIPWELGLAEVQQALVASGLRGRVRLQTDGGLKTGRDVVMAALLGAEEFGFGSAALVSLGCVMARQCHANTCPAGIATQRDDLRARYRGEPSALIRFFTAVARDVREILARLACRSLAEAVGRTDLLRARVPRGRFKVSCVDLSRLVPGPRLPDGSRVCLGGRNDPPRTGYDLDEQALSRLRLALGTGSPAALDFPITNADRAVGARIAGELSLPGAARLPRPVVLSFHGSAGQSFGAFCVEGMRLSVRGEANDHVAKGMSGGQIAIFPDLFSRSADPVLAGNAVLYGATGGRLFIAGRVGERFAVRNSGATAVVEGVGDHACEYMTGGRVIVLGALGRNFGAGMTGGVAYVLDRDALVARRVHADAVEIESLTWAEARELRLAIDAHRCATASGLAQEVLEDFQNLLPLFRKVRPRPATAGSLASLRAAAFPSVGRLRRAEAVRP
jgi:glutamate synthase (ferredoxin)